MINSLQAAHRASGSTKQYHPSSTLFCEWPNA